MENNQKKLNDFADATTGLLGGLTGMIDGFKKDLTPDQRKKVDEEVAKIDFEGATAELRKSQKTFNDIFK